MSGLLKILGYCEVIGKATRVNDKETVVHVEDGLDYIYDVCGGPWKRGLREYRRPRIAEGDTVKIRFRKGRFLTINDSEHNRIYIINQHPRYTGLDNVH